MDTIGLIHIDVPLLYPEAIQYEKKNDDDDWFAHVYSVQSTSNRLHFSSV